MIKVSTLLEKKEMEDNHSKIVISSLRNMLQFAII